MLKTSELWMQLKPYVQSLVGTSGPALATGQYPDALLRDGSRSLTGSLSVGSGVTIDGIDIDVFAANTAAWQVGHLAAADPHPVYVLKTRTVTPAFGVLLDGAGVAVDLSANRTIGADYTTTGAANKLVATDTNSQIVGSNFIAQGYFPSVVFDDTDTGRRILYGKDGKWEFTAVDAGGGSPPLSPTAPETGILSNFNGADVAPAPGLTAPVFHNGNNMSRVSNRLEQTVFAGSGNASWVWTGSSAVDFEVYVTMPTTGVQFSFASLWGRATGLNSGSGNPSLNMVRAYLNWESGGATATWVIQQVINGADGGGVIASVAGVSTGAGDSFWLRAVGTTVKLWRKPNGSGSWTLIATATTSITGAGSFGGGVSGPTPHATFDDFGGGALAGSGGVIAPVFIVQDNGTIGSPTFASGFAGSGWRIDNGEATAGERTAEFDNLIVRGLMRVYELVINKIRVSRGSLIVSPGGGKVSAVSGTGPYTLTFDDDHGLVVNDLMRAQKFTGTGTYVSRLTVTAVPTSTTATVTLFSGTAPEAGYEYAVIGNTSDANRQGLIYLTADDSGAPFMDVVDGVAAHGDWGSFAKTKVRLGKLTGITDGYWGALSGYGLYSNNIYLTGAIRAMSGRIDGVLDIGTSGEIRQGTGAWGTDFTGTRMFNTGGVGRWATYDHDVIQAYVNTDGKVYAGAGNVYLDANGLTINAPTSAPSIGALGSTQALNFVAGGAWRGGLYSYYNTDTNYIILKSKSVSGSDAGITMTGRPSAGQKTFLDLIADTITMIGNVEAGGFYYSQSQKTPASNGTGTTGQITWDASYIYICTATDTWKRAALSTY